MTQFKPQHSNWSNILSRSMVTLKLKNTKWVALYRLRLNFITNNGFIRHFQRKIAQITNKNTFAYQRYHRQIHHTTQSFYVWGGKQGYDESSLGGNGKQTKSESKVNIPEMEQLWVDKQEI